MSNTTLFPRPPQASPSPAAPDDRAAYRAWVRGLDQLRHEIEALSAPEGLSPERAAERRTLYARLRRYEAAHQAAYQRALLESLRALVGEETWAVASIHALRLTKRSRPR